MKVSIYPSGHANDEGALESFSALVIYRESKLQISLRDFVAFGKIIPTAGEVAYGHCTVANFFIATNIKSKINTPSRISENVICNFIEKL